MPVPESIRKVPRPVNTIVQDNGKDGPNRYPVRERIHQLTEARDRLLPKLMSGEIAV